MRLIVRSDAELDAAEGFEWYESQREGLGYEFIDEISACIAGI
jgi:hypothetical protein